MNKKISDMMKEDNRIMKNRATGVVLIGGKYSNFNADFDGNPKQNSLGEYVASDFAKKYANKEYWANKGYLVFGRRSYIKTMVKKVEDLRPRLLDERYEYLFESKKDNKQTVFKNLLECVDLMNFGFVYAGKDVTANLTGAVQYSYGINKDENAEIVNEDMLSPFSSGEDKGTTTKGSRNLLVQSCFSYGFTVNPYNYNHVSEIVEDFKGYPRVAYEAFKESCLSDVTRLTSVAKNNCYNELALFIEFKEESLKNIPDINNLVEYNQIENKKVVNINKIYDYLKEMKEDIESVEIYYNPFTSIVEGDETGIEDLIKKYSIINPAISL